MNIEMVCARKDTIQRLHNPLDMGGAVLKRLEKIIRGVLLDLLWFCPVGPVGSG